MHRQARFLILAWTALVLAVFLLMVDAARADDYTVLGEVYPSLGAAQAAAIAEHESFYCSGGFANVQDGSAHSIGVVYNGVVAGGDHQWIQGVACYHDEGHEVFGQNYEIRLDPTTCPTGQADENGCQGACDGSITGKAFWRPISSADPGGNVCSEASNCVMQMVNRQNLNNATDDLVEYVGTGDNCSASEPNVTTTPSNEQTNCISSGGDVWCVPPDPEDQNCGWLNDEYLCLGEIPPGECTFFGNGDMACDVGAGSPPAPDDGTTPGQTATPDTTIDNNGNTTNVYNDNTVGSSVGDTQGSQQTGDEPADLEVEIDLSEIIEDEPAANTITDPVDDVQDELENLLDGVIEEIDTGAGFVEAGDEQIGGIVTGLIPDASCVSANVSAGPYNFEISCASGESARNVIGWAMRIMFILGMFHLVTQKPD
jgi:hypothetical protein